MDRAIKIRAWDKGWKEIVYSDVIHHNINFGITIHKAYKPSTDDTYFPIQENLTLMQFTGLYDCEGKEIWESDIIEEYGREAFRYVVAWDTENAAWGYKGERKNYNWAHGWGESQRATLQNMKVIGNLYEHPNLLNNETNT